MSVVERENETRGGWAMTRPRSGSARACGPQPRAEGATLLASSDARLLDSSLNASRAANSGGGSHMTPVHRAHPLERTASAVALAVLLVPSVTLAYAGQGLLEFARNFVLAPLGLFAIVVGIAAAMFKPEMVRTAIWSAVVCAFLFFIISAAPTLVNLLQNSAG
jgi:hypothetical protein